MLRGACAIAVAMLMSLVGCRQILGLDTPSVTARFDGGGGGGGSDALDANDDEDGDGVPNGSDNCPTIPNADQADYDGDGHGDVCDLCPHLPSAADPDSDGDGVGDACDPRPGMQDKRIYWTSFRDPAELASWTQTGTWMVGAGGVTQSDASASSASLQRPGNLVRPYVVTAVTLPALAPVPSAVAINVVGSTGYGCGIYAASSSTQLIEEEQSTLNSTAWTAGYASTQITLTQNLVNNLQDCEGFASGSTVIATQNPGLTTSGAVALFTNDTPATFAYLFVVETSP